MPSLGGYTSVRELYRSGLRATYAARADSEPEGAEPAFALRIFRADALIMGPERAAAAVSGFLARAAEQKAVADHPSCAGRWARVHAIGRADEEDRPGAFAVTDLAAQGTALALAQRRVRLGPPAMARIVGGAVRALAALHAAHARPHGRLRPGDVLLMGPPDADPGRGGVALTDPVPRAELTRASPAGDLRALGELIHLLATHQEFQGAWPVQYTPAWKALGRNAGGWIELVNLLLDPNDKADRPTLDDLAARIDRLGVVVRPRWPYAAAAAGAVLLVGVGALVYRVYHPPWDQAAIDNWQVLSQAWPWYAPLVQTIGPESGRPPGSRPLLDALESTAPGVKSALGKLIATKDKATPVLEVWRSGPPPENSDPRVRGLINPTRELVGPVKAVEDAIFADDWPPRKALSDARGRVAAWPEATARIDSLLNAVTRDSGDALSKGLLDAINAGKSLEEFDAAWRRVETARTELLELPNADARLRAILADPLQRLVTPLPSAPDPIAALADAAKNTAVALEKARQVAPDVDLAAFRASDAYRELTAPPSLPALNDWTTAAADFARIKDTPDPRLGLPERFDAAEALARSLAAEPYSLDVAALSTDLATARAAYAPVQDTTQVPWVTMRRAGIESAARTAGTALDKIAPALQSRKSVRERELGELLKQIKSADVAVTGSDVLDKAWKKWQADHADLDIAGYPRARRLKDELDKLRDRFTGAKGDTGAMAPAETVVAKALLAAAQGERERALATALAALPALDAKAVGSVQPPTAYTTFMANLQELANALGEAEAKLDAGDDTAQALATIRSVKDPPVTPEGIDPLTLAAVKAAVNDLKRRAGEIEELATVTDDDRLIAKIAAADPARPGPALAAWDRLAELKAPTEAVLLRAPDLARELHALVGAQPEPRRTALAGRIDNGLRKRWSTFAAAQTDAAALKSAFDKRARFGVNDGNLADARLNYNLSVYTLAARMRDNKPAREDVLAAAKEFLRHEPSRIPAVARESLEEIAGTRKSKKEPIDPAKSLGPAAANKGWLGAVQSVGGAPGVVYTRNGTTLRFVRIQRSGIAGDDPPVVYIADRELTIADAAEILGPAASRTIRDGLDGAEVQGWDFPPNAAAGGLIPRAAWLRPGSARSVFDPAQNGPVTPNHPFQAVRPPTLARIAAAVSCRPPTTEEWLEAIRQFPPPPTAIPNLRDQTVLTQTSHAAGLAGVERVSGPDSQAVVNGSAAPPAGADGVLWFEDSTSGPGPLHHLQGNVAELVSTTGDFGAPPPTSTAPAFAAIGASALSPWNDFKTIVPVDPSTPYSDLGIRLAFGGTGSEQAPKPPWEQLASALDTAFQMSPDGGGRAVSPPARP